MALTRSENRRHISSSGRKRIIFLAVGALVVCAVLIIIHVISNWQFKSYSERYIDSNENVNAYSYYQFGDNVLKAASDQTSYVTDRNEIIWTDRYDMTDPQTVFCGDHCAVYDRNGNLVRIYDKNGLKNSIETTVPMVTASVSDKGGAAVLTDDGNNVWIDYYDASGELISTIKSQVTANGYPVSMTLSYDGVLLAVSYISIYNGEYYSNIVFYNFGSEGKGRTNNIVSSFNYENELVPAVRFLENGSAAAFCEDGFYLYSGKQVPEENGFVESEGQLLSTFVSRDNIGVIWDMPKSEGTVLELYDASGKLKMSKTLSFSYTSIDVTNDEIVLSNVGQLYVLRKNGSVKYDGNLDVLIKDIVALKNNRFVVLGEGSFRLITLG